jgi:hypothetical protein
MSSKDAPDSKTSQLELVKSVWARIRTCLENDKAQVYEEIRAYPRPIPACDQHFNYLLAERARIAQELGRLGDALQESLSGIVSLERIEEFIRASGSLDEDARQQIRNDLKEGLSKEE